MQSWRTNIWIWYIHYVNYIKNWYLFNCRDWVIVAWKETQFEKHNKNLDSAQVLQMIHSLNTSFSSREKSITILEMQIFITIFLRVSVLNILVKGIKMFQDSRTIKEALMDMEEAELGRDNPGVSTIIVDYNANFVVNLVMLCNGIIIIFTNLFRVLCFKDQIQHFLLLHKWQQRLQHQRQWLASIGIQTWVPQTMWQKMWAMWLQGTNTWGRTEFIWEMAQVCQLIIWDLHLFFLSFAPKSYLWNIFYMFPLLPKILSLFRSLLGTTTYSLNSILTLVLSKIIFPRWS